MRTCELCKEEFSEVWIIDGKSYCRDCKYVSKDVLKDENMIAIMKDSSYKDKNGERIWFPKDGRPYFDQALRRTFNSIGEKARYMKEKNLIMDGSTMPKRLPIEAGDMRNKSYRRAMRMED